jgi:hypothetical protein
MPTPSRKHTPKPGRDAADRRRALELLAASRDGCNEAIMLAHGFTIPLLVELIRAGLASATTERRPPAARGCLRAHYRGRAMGVACGSREWLNNP